MIAAATILCVVVLVVVFIYACSIAYKGGGDIR